MKHSEDYCPTCKKDTQTLIRSKRDIFTYEGVTIDCDVHVRYCVECMNEIPDVKLAKETRKLVLDRYRLKARLFSGDQLVDIRKGYGFTLDQFAKFLGVETKDLRDYEHGEVQPICVDNLIKLCADADNFVFIWHRVMHKFSQQTIDKLEARFPTSVKEVIASCYSQEES